MTFLRWFLFPILTFCFLLFFFFFFFFFLFCFLLLLFLFCFSSNYWNYCSLFYFPEYWTYFQITESIILFNLFSRELYQYMRVCISSFNLILFCKIIEAHISIFLFGSFCEVKSCPCPKCWNYLRRLVTKPTLWLCAQRRLRSAWASAQSDQGLRCALSE